MVANNAIPEVMDSKSYTASLVDPEKSNEAIFLDRALFLQEHGYFKEMSVQELRQKLRDLYRESRELRDMLENDDVWK